MYVERQGFGVWVVVREDGQRAAGPFKSKISAEAKLAQMRRAIQKRAIRGK